MFGVGAAILLDKAQSPFLERFPLQNGERWGFTLQTRGACSPGLLYRLKDFKSLRPLGLLNQKGMRLASLEGRTGLWAAEKPLCKCGKVFSFLSASPMPWLMHPASGTVFTLGEEKKGCSVLKHRTSFCHLWLVYYRSLLLLKGDLKHRAVYKPAPDTPCASLLEMMLCKPWALKAKPSLEPSAVASLVFQGFSTTEDHSP